MEVFKHSGARVPSVQKFYGQLTFEEDKKQIRKGE